MTTLFTLMAAISIVLIVYKIKDLQRIKEAKDSSKTFVDVYEEVGRQPASSCMIGAINAIVDIIATPILIAYALVHHFGNALLANTALLVWILCFVWFIVSQGSLMVGYTKGFLRDPMHTTRQKVPWDSMVVYMIFFIAQLVPIAYLCYIALFLNGFVSF